MAGDWDSDVRRIGGPGTVAPDFDYIPERRPRPRRRASWPSRILAALSFILIGAAVAAASILLAGERGLLPFAQQVAQAPAPASPDPSQPDAGPPDATPPETTPQTPPIDIPESNLVARQAQQWGVGTCLSSIAGLSDYLTRDMSYTWRAQRGNRDANGEMFIAALAEQETATGTKGMSVLFAAPVAAGGCNAAYQTTVYYPAACPQVQEAVFATFSTKVEFGDIALSFSTPEGGAVIYMLPAGEAGCVVVKTEQFY